MQHDVLLIVGGSGSAACTSYTSIDGCCDSTVTDGFAALKGQAKVTCMDG